MKILWFSTSPSNAAEEFGYDHLGCGWIASLETIISQSQQFELGICFFYEGDKYKKIIKNNTTYYGIPLPKLNSISRIIHRHLGKLNDEYDSPYFEKVIAEFKPDLIHVFGTENGYGKILINKFDKVVFHLQGLMEPITNVFYPATITKHQSLLNDNFGNIVRGLTPFHTYKSFISRATREKKIIRHFKYFSGRTTCDRNYIRLLNENATYFHCEEFLRPIFFNAQWEPANAMLDEKKIKIATTINPNIYKGLDLIYRVLSLLDNKDIEWNIFGMHENNPLNSIIKKSLELERNEKIIFHGPVRAEALVEQLKQCDFFIHPSYIDNSPNSVCEAMLLGMPVLASSVGGVNSLIKHNETGFLFNPYDAYELAGLILDLSIDYNKALDAGKKARATAHKRHDAKSIEESISNMYKAIIQS